MSTPTITEIRERWKSASPGPWHWFGNVDTSRIWLGRWANGLGGTTVMDFVRWGMQGAQPRFIDDDWMMNKASEMPVFEVAPTATHRADRRVYRADLIGVRHPDAEAIAAASADVAQLLDVVSRLEDLADWHDTKADKARRFRPATENRVMDKAAEVHEQAAARIRDALKGGESDD